MDYEELEHVTWAEGFNRGLFYGIVLGLLLGGLASLLYHTLV